MPQYQQQRDRSRGRLRARCRPQGDADHHPGVLRRPTYRSISCQRPLTRLPSHTIPAPPLIRSLDRNQIGDEGALALAAILNETKITKLRCAAAPECLVPSYSCVSYASVGEHLSSLLPAPLPHSHPRNAALERAPRGPDRAFSCQAGFPRIPTPPLPSPRRSLRSNGISGQAKQAVRDAAGSGVSIEF